MGKRITALFIGALCLAGGSGTREWKMDFRFFGEQKSSKETNE